MLRCLKHNRAIDTREHSATVYISDQDHVGIRIRGHRHVDYVTIAKIKLRHASCPFKHNRIIALAQTVKSIMGYFSQLIFSLFTEILVGVGIT